MIDTFGWSSTGGRDLSSFTDRMLGAAALNSAAYEEVEGDTSATGQAMGVVFLSSVAAGIGSVGIGAGGVGGVVVGGIAALISWVFWASLTYLIGTRLLPEPQTRADVGELMRTLGFAQSPGLLRILGVIPGLGPVILFAVSVWMLVAMVTAVRQALDFTSTLRAVGVCVIGWVLSLVIALAFILLFGSAST